MSLIISFGITQAMEVEWELSSVRIERERKQQLKMERKIKRDVAHAKKLAEQKQAKSYAAVLIKNARSTQENHAFESNIRTTIDDSCSNDFFEKSYNIVERSVISPDGICAACPTTGCFNGRLYTEILFINIKTGKVINTISRYASFEKAIWLADSNQCIVHFKNLKMIIFNVATSKETMLLADDNESLYSDSFNKLLNLILLKNKSALALYDVKTGKKIAQLINESLTPFKAAWSNNGNQLAHTMDGLKLVNARTRESIGEFSTLVKAQMLLWSPDDTMIALKFEKQQYVKIARNDWQACRIDCHGIVHNFAWSPDSALIAILAGRDIEIWEPKSRKLWYILPATLHPRLVPFAKLLWNSTSTKLIVFIPQSKQEIIWDIATIKDTLLLPPSDIVSGIFWDMNGFLMTYGGKNSVPKSCYVTNQEIELIKEA